MLANLNLRLLLDFYHFKIFLKIMRFVTIAECYANFNYLVINSFLVVYCNIHVKSDYQLMITKYIHFLLNIFN